MHASDRSGRRSTIDTCPRLVVEALPSAALFFLVSPGQPSQTSANTVDLASVPPVAGDDPVNNSDPSGDSSNPADIVENFPLRSGGTTPLRAGCPTCSFGWWKINFKHNLFRKDIMGYTILRGLRSNPAPNVYDYTQWFKNTYSGVIFQLLVANNENLGSDPRIAGLEVGVTTAYCVGYTPACPLWVNIVPLEVVPGPTTTAIGCSTRPPVLYTDYEEQPSS